MKRINRDRCYQRHNHDEDAQAGSYFAYDEAEHLLGEYNQHGSMATPRKK